MLYEVITKRGLPDALNAKDEIFFSAEAMIINMSRPSTLLPMETMVNKEDAAVSFRNQFMVSL